jgi:vancomycin permeability regulator SanA
VWSKVKRAVILTALLGALVGVACITTQAYVAHATASVRYTSIAAVPSRPVALVFGAYVMPDGTLSAMLADRVDAAVALYRTGKVDHLLFSGDNSRPGYDEVSAMLAYALHLGVPRDAITLDYAGFDTYDSCYRAKAIFGVREAILVTQRYHLPRAVYDCTKLGIDAVGLATADWGVYDAPMMIAYTAREAVADVKSIWDVHVSHREATLMGPYVGLR